MPMLRLPRLVVRADAGALCRALALLAVAAAAAAPVQALTNPPIQVAPQGVEYMCGGSNPAELAFMQTVAPRWGATFEFAVAHAPRGQFTQPVQIRVTDKYNGTEVLQASGNGPFLLARLQPGTYEVQATLGELSLTQTMTVALGVPGRALFLWPSNVDMAAVARPQQALAQGR